MNINPIKVIAKQILISVFILIIFCFSYAFKRHIFPSEIVFYESILFSFLFMIFLTIFIKWLFSFGASQKIISSLYPSLLLLILFNSLVPTILDRSVSITIIGALKESSHPLSEEEIRHKFNQVYVLDQNAVGVRLREQMANGNINKNENEEYELTKKGVFTSDMLSVTTKFFNVNPAYIDQ